MNLNVNKEMILKHRFWVVLGFNFCLVLVGIIYLQSVDAEEEKTKLHKALLKGKGVNPKANQASIEKISGVSNQAKTSENKIWKAAYQCKKRDARWAKAVEDKFNFMNGPFANDIMVLKLTDKKEWPADTATLKHGILRGQEEDSFEIEDRKGQRIKFFRMEQVKNVNVVDQNKQIPFARIQELVDKNLLAVSFQTGRYFGDTLTETERRAFESSYKQQIKDILKIVDPLDESGNGVVQLRDWLYRPDELPDEAKNVKDPLFIRYVTKEWDKTVNLSKEAWIAQENIWIQREIYRIIREVNDSISIFKTPEGKLSGGKDKGKRYTFQNSYFTLELALDAKNDLSLLIKNRLPRRQKLDLAFRVKMNEGGFKPEIIKVSGNALEPAGAKGDYFEQIYPSTKDSPRTGLFGVEQVLTWQTAAIKRIDQVSIGSNGTDDISHSHRTFPDDLSPFDPKDKEDGGEVAKPKFGGFVRPGGEGLKGRGPRVAAGAGNVKVLEHDLWTNRYDEVTDQVRRLPVGVVLIVDQDHVDRVLTAFNNSKFRFLETQVLLNQYTGSLQPPAPEAKDTTGQPGPNVPRFPGPREGFGPGIRPPGTPPLPDGGGGGDSSLDANMELVIYGIMTLYQRYPPRPPAAPTDKRP